MDICKADKLGTDNQEYTVLLQFAPLQILTRAVQSKHSPYTVNCSTVDRITGKHKLPGEKNIHFWHLKFK
jgi:hypothetical protein